MIYLQLIWEFFKTGLFSVGGGLATLPFLKAISLKYPWFTPNDLLDMIAVSESTPGPMGVNTATYAGFHAAGLRGSVIATCSLVFFRGHHHPDLARPDQVSRFSRLSGMAFTACVRPPPDLIFGAMLEVFAASLLHTENWAGIVSIGSVINVPAIIIFLVLSLGIWKLKAASDRVYPDRRGMRHCV